MYAISGLVTILILIGIGVLASVHHWAGSWTISDQIHQNHVSTDSHTGM